MFGLSPRQRHLDFQPGLDRSVSRERLDKPRLAEDPQQRKRYTHRATPHPRARAESIKSATAPSVRLPGWQPPTGPRQPGSGLCQSVRG